MCGGGASLTPAGRMLTFTCLTLLFNISVAEPGPPPPNILNLLDLTISFVTFSDISEYVVFANEYNANIMKDKETANINNTVAPPPYVY